MDKDADKVISACKMIDLYGMGQYLDDELARIRAEARAEAPKEAAERAIALLRLIRMADEWDDLTDARLSAAILTDEPKEEL